MWRFTNGAHQTPKKLKEVDVRSANFALCLAQPRAMIGTLTVSMSIDAKVWTFGFSSYRAFSIHEIVLK